VEKAKAAGDNRTPKPGGKTAVLKRAPTPSSQFPFRAGHLALNSRVVLAGQIRRFGKRLEQGLDDVVRFIAI
jgi:hypothetical protein